MNRQSRSLLLSTLVLCLGGPPARAALSPAGPATSPPFQGFLRNAGQVKGPARYYAMGQGSAVYFEPSAVVLDHPPSSQGAGTVLRVDFPAAPGKPKLVASEPQPSRVNLLLGKDPSRWRSGMPTYGEIRYVGVAPGTDLVYHVAEGGLKYDLVIAPGAELSDVILRYQGADGLTVGDDGTLSIASAGGLFREGRPYLFQERGGQRVEVEGGYRVVSGNRLGFWATGYDASLPLVVDPGITWSTFIGGSVHDYPYRVATDANGDIYIAGYTESVNYPTSSGAYQPTKNLDRDVFVTKLRGDGTSIIWSTFLGGSATDQGLALAVDTGGNVYVAGNTGSSDFPVSASGFRRTYGGGGDGFVTKLSASGGLSYSTYLGGGADDMVYSVAVDGSGFATVAGGTGSVDFPITSGAFKTALHDGGEGFVTKLNTTGSQLVYSTFLGSDGGSDQIFGVALDSQGRPTVIGRTNSAAFPTSANVFDPTADAFWDGFAMRLNVTGTACVYSTYLSGSGYDEPWAVAVDANNNAYVVGRTASPNMQTTPGAFQRTKAGGTYDCFVMKISSDATTLVYGTYLGGAADEYIYGIAVNAAGEALLTGYTDSANFPVSADAYDGTANGGSDAFVARLGASGGSLIYSSYLGGSGADFGRGITLKPNGQVVVAGFTTSTSFPTTAGSYDQSFNGTSTYYDGFVTTLSAGAGGNVGVEEDVVAGTLEMESPHPNPFRDGMAFGISLSKAGAVSVRVLDIQGRAVRTLEDGVVPAGRLEWTWDGRDGRGRDVGSGVFLVEVATAEGRMTRRIARLR
jgi:hypothetical protein